MAHTHGHFTWAWNDECEAAQDEHHRELCLKETWNGKGTGGCNCRFIEFGDLIKVGDELCPKGDQCEFLEHGQQIKEE